MTIPIISDHTDAVIAKLQSLGLIVGDAEAPEGAEEKYAVVYQILPSGSFSGTLENPNEDAHLVYQVTCVGRIRAQAEWVLDKALGILDGFDGIPERVVSRVIFQGGAGVERDDDQDPPLFYATPRFEIITTPA